LPQSTQNCRPIGFSRCSSAKRILLGYWRQAVQAIGTGRDRQRLVHMNEVKKERTYSDAEVEARLKQDLPHWYLEGGWIRRRYRTHGWKGTLMVINTVGHLAEAAWHHPDITASYAWVEVRLQNHAAKGITDKDFELAKKIEEVVHWQPGKQGGALEGTPEKDQRFAYVKYDA
jgi:4a-hydroxytetrahydrobiopterin dehydratase